jgi:hypothetical protein
VLPLFAGSAALARDAAFTVSVMAQAQRARRATWLTVAVVLTVVAVWQWRHGEAIAATTPDGDARVTAVLSRARRRVAAETRVTRVDLTSVLGAGVLDLRNVRLAPGVSLTVDVLGVAGGLTIRVPDGWVIDTMTVPVLGSWHDERRPSAVVQTAPGGPAPRLVVRGVVILGRLTVES